jgi:hypothetical protein
MTSHKYKFIPTRVEAGTLYGVVLRICVCGANISRDYKYSSLLRFCGQHKHYKVEGGANFNTSTHAAVTTVSFGATCCPASTVYYVHFVICTLK